MFWQAFVYVALGLIVAGGVLAALRYVRLPPAMRLVAGLVWFTAAIEFTAMAVIRFVAANLFLMPVALLGEVLLLTLAYRLALASPRLNRVLLGALVMYVAFLAIEFWLKLGTVQYFVTAQVVTDVCVLGLAALYFWKLLSELHVVRLQDDPFFWLSVAVAIYSLGDMFIALSSDYIVAHYSRETQLLVLRGVRNFFSIALYAAYFMILWMRPPKPSF